MGEPVRSVTSRENTREERRAASVVVLRHAQSLEDLRELLNALGLNQPQKEGAR